MSRLEEEGLPVPRSWALLKTLADISTGSDKLDFGGSSSPRAEDDDDVRQRYIQKKKHPKQAIRMKTTHKKKPCIQNTIHDTRKETMHKKAIYSTKGESKHARVRL